MTVRTHTLGSIGRDDRGSALVTALLATLLLTSMGLGLLMLSDTESAIASNYRSNGETFYAADAAVERVVQDILLVPRWNDVLTGITRSSFVDDTLTPTTPTGQHLDLTALTAEVQGDTDATAPWGPNNPQWHLFAYGPLSEMLGQGSLQSDAYVAVWISDDPSETDNNPSSDANGVLTVYAKAFGPNGSERAVELTVAKTNSTEIERGQIAQRGQEELNQRSRKAAVQLPGQTPTVADLNTSIGGMVTR
jgi:hypothetical protein